MSIFEFVRQNLAWIATIALVWPINIPLAALAYKIRLGHERIRISRAELWGRSAFASLCLFGMMVPAIGADYWLASVAEIPAGMVHVLVYVVFCAAGWWLFLFAFGLDDPIHGLSLFFIYLYLPILVLLPVNRYVFRIWQPLLDLVLPWLVPPT